MPQVRDIEYFIDGCTGQYKNYKNFLNLCYHKRKFGLDTTWLSFATSHGIDGIVERQMERTRVACADH